MAAIITVRLDGEDATYKGFIDAVQRGDIKVLELGSFYYMVTIGKADIGTGFETLQALMEKDVPGSSAGLSRADFG
jgi:hypothetical protein